MATEMILYTPHSNIAEIKGLFPDILFEKDKIYGAYTSISESGDAVKCLIEINGRFCEIKNIKTDLKDKLLTEGLMRASLNYAGNRGAYIAKCKDENISDVLILLGFSKSGDFYEGDIPTLLQGSCCKH